MERMINDEERIVLNYFYKAREAYLSLEQSQPEETFYTEAA